MHGPPPTAGPNASPRLPSPGVSGSTGGPETCPPPGGIPASPRLGEMQGLAGRIAHDLNNILTASLGFAELLEGCVAGNERARRYLGEVREAGLRAKAFARLLEGFGGRRMLHPATVDLCDVVRAGLPAMRERLGGAVPVVSDLEEGTLRVCADPVALERVLLAVAEQAGVLWRGPRPLILEAGGTGAEDSGWAWIRLRYPGVLLPVGVAYHLLEPYALPKGQGPASGLGLAAAWGCARQHGGDLAFTQAADGEHLFELTLPRE